jgi:hypothetical protein
MTTAPSFGTTRLPDRRPGGDEDIKQSTHGRCQQRRLFFRRGLRAIAALEGPQFRQCADPGNSPRNAHGLAALRAERRRSRSFCAHGAFMRALCPARFALDQPRRVGSEVGAVKSAIPARGAPLLPACGEKVRMRGRSRLPSTAAGAPKQGSRPRVDTRCHRPTLTVFRGELREELRDRDSGNPLNLIRVMPAKGQEYPESASTSRDSIANTRSRESARTEEAAPCRLRCSSPD